MKKFAIVFSFCFFVFRLVGQEQKEINPNGYTKFYYDNGKTASEGFMRDGKPDGYWKTFYETGKIKSQGNRKDFELDSLWFFYNDEGKIIKEYYYTNGKKNGIIKTFDQSGKLLVEEAFINNMKQGITNEFNSEGKVLKKTIFVEGKEQGLAYEYDKEGIIITIIDYQKGFIKRTDRINRRDANGLKQGIWKEFFSNGKIKKEEIFLDGKKNGYFKEYNQFGNLVSVSKWENGTELINPPELAKIETITSYHKNGKIKEIGNYKDSIPEGVFRQYDTTGIIIGAEIYLEGVLIGKGLFDLKGNKQGKWKEFYEGGILKGEGEYKDGVKIENWKYLYENGKIDQLGKYDKKGNPIGIWQWYYENGLLLREETYVEGLRSGKCIEKSNIGVEITQGEYVDGLKEGKWFFQIDDYREEGEYVAGERNGIWKHFYTSSDKRRFEGAFINGKPDGKQIWWYESGKVWQEGKYVYGIKEGNWKYFDEEGYVSLSITYKEGVEVKFDGVRLRFEDPRGRDAEKDK